MSRAFLCAVCTSDLTKSEAAVPLFQMTTTALAASALARISVSEAAPAFKLFVPPDRALAVFRFDNFASCQAASRCLDE